MSLLSRGLCCIVACWWYGIVSAEILTVTTAPIITEYKFGGKIAPYGEISVYCPFANTRIQQRINFGEFVEKGDIIFSYSSPSAEEKLLSLQLQLLEYQRQYQHVVNFKNSYEYRSANMQYQRAQKNMHQQELKLSKSEKLYNDGIISKEVLDADKHQHDLASETLSLAEHYYELKNSSTSNDELKVLEQKITHTKSIMSVLEQNLEHKSIFAPHSGQLVRPIATNKNLSGEFLCQESEIIAKLDLRDQYVVQFKVLEEALAVLGLMDTVEVFVPAYAQSISGIVKEINWLDEGDANKISSYEVVVVLDKINFAPNFILSGREAKVRKILAKNTTNPVIPSRAISFKDNKFVVTSGDNSNNIVVKLGLRDNNNVEITSGLSIGDKIVVPS